MAKKKNKIPQALKFEETLMNELKELAEALGMTYNGYVEHILTNHVTAVKKVLIKQQTENGQNSK